MNWLLLCCLSTALAVPRPPREHHTPHAPHHHHHHHKSHNFTVQQVKATAPARSQFERHFQTARKYNGRVPLHFAVKLVDAQAQYSVAATPVQGDSFYLCPVTIGGQTLNLDFDTGSSDLWVYSSQTPSSVLGREVYNPSTGQLLAGQSWEISYGDGSGASGDVYADTVEIGGLSIEGQAVEVATSLIGSWSSPDQDGLVGLAFSDLNCVQPTQQKTFFDNAITQGLQSQLFTVSLKHGEPGSYDFGYLDPNKYTGEITYLPLNQATYWQYGDEILGNTIFDTGTTLMYLPTEVVEQYYAQIATASNAQGLWTFDCTEQVPDFVFSLGTFQTGVSGAYMNFGQADAINCIGGLQDRDGLGLPISILGDAFLKDKFVVFDVNNGSPQVGIAAATPAVATT